LVNMGGPFTGGIGSRGVAELGTIRVQSLMAMLVAA